MTSETLITRIQDESSFSTSFFHMTRATVKNSRSQDRVRYELLQVAETKKLLETKKEWSLLFEGSSFLVKILKSFVCLAPVDQAPECFYIFPSVILVVDIICMFENIQDH